MTKYGTQEVSQEIQTLTNKAPGMLSTLTALSSNEAVDETDQKFHKLLIVKRTKVPHNNRKNLRAIF